MRSGKFTIIVSGASLLFALNLPAQTAKTSAHAGHSYGSLGYSDSVNNGSIPKDTLKGSTHRTAMLTIANCHIHIEYGSPGVHDRVIWGGLVPYDNVWVTGAHSATSISFNKAVRIGGKLVEAGTYAFFTIPGKESWTIIINKNPKQHLADDYKQSEDILRTEQKAIPHPMTQRLTYTIEQSNAKGGTIKIFWEKLELNLPFEVAGS